MFLRNNQQGTPPNSFCHTPDLSIARGRQRGRLTIIGERELLVLWIQEAASSGARIKPACEEAYISLPFVDNCLMILSRSIEESFRNRS